MSNSGHGHVPLFLVIQNHRVTESFTTMDSSRVMPSTIVFMDQRQMLVSNTDILNQKKTQFRMVKKRVKKIIDQLKNEQILK